MCQWLVQLVSPADTELPVSFLRTNSPAAWTTRGQLDRPSSPPGPPTRGVEQPADQHGEGRPRHRIEDRRRPGRCMACLPFRGRTARLYLRLYAPRRGLEAVLSACLGGRVPLPSFVAPVPSSARSLRSPCLGRSWPTLRFGHILDPQPRPAVACRNCGSIITSGHIIRRP